MSSYDKDIEDIQITPAGMKVLISSEVGEEVDLNIKGREAVKEGGRSKV